ncbi:uncharacterized protein BXIN_1915 [Babesia sp. Xinjiang]|uniref:uncharacterized protein n=1 Tax=Babesia sp. Xinjiang TaxID=462227 RepID=UPI000A24D2F0|nr:uncharacterized protein BXIN_1915 [Babesia sp. Xinjiang]ORM40325.1 hypothetical protein BXIN_1915 [Babesia sp. Xinjiang]
MHLPLTALVLWLSVCCFYHLVECSQSLDSSRSSGSITGSGRTSQLDSLDSGINDRDVSDDEDNYDVGVIYVFQGLYTFLCIFGPFEAFTSLLILLFLNYVQKDDDNDEDDVDQEDAAKERIRRLMDDLVTASLELQEINRSLDEL